MDQSFIHWPLRKALLVVSCVLVLKNQKELNGKSYFSSLVPHGTDSMRLTVAFKSNGRSSCMLCIVHQMSSLTRVIHFERWKSASELQQALLGAQEYTSPTTVLHTQYLGNMHSSGCSCIMLLLCIMHGQSIHCN